ncbi:MAG: AraC family transcriptional regulator [Alphaproteobacteria bacterium]|uniref:helix-turn-helix domain-containing protein n=1 Tax=Pacificispira sp. TaxID=2888761 RepID=UPI0032FCB548
MKSAVKSILPVRDVCCLQFDHMAVDYWRVEAKAGATGQYLSPDPRFVVFFDRAEIALNRTGGGEDARCDVCYVPAGLALSGRIDKPGYLEHIDIHVDEAHLRRVTGEAGSLNSALFLSASVELGRLCAMLADECQHKERPAGYGESLTTTMIHEIFHLGARQSRAGGRPDWLEHVMEYVVENLDEPLKVDDLAALADMSRSEFSRRFKELAGQTPHQWVMSTRIKQAQQLLSEGGLLSHVAHDTGFSDQAHFSRNFRQATGLTPGQWTRRYVSTNRGPILQDSLSHAL